MAFTNVYDDTYPPDTQLANLLGQDLRNFRLDVQQRMAAISGLDASKPNFAGDAQPNNWNGILFFATDTAQIYQFNNPSWTNITTTFLKTAAFFKDGTNHVVTTATNAYNVVLPVLVGSNVVRGRFGYTIPSLTASPSSDGIEVTISLGGTFLSGFITAANNSWVSSGNQIVTDFIIANRSSVSSQITYAYTNANSNLTGSATTGSASTVNTGVSQALTIGVSIVGAATFNVSFDFLVIEIL